MAVKRLYLKDLHRMMDEMSIGLAEKVHLLFMNNYINCSIPDGVICFVERRINIMTMGSWRNVRCGKHITKQSHDPFGA